MARDFVRYVQDLRKRADFNVSDRIIVYYHVDGEAASAIARHTEYIQQETLADVLSADEFNASRSSGTFTLGGQPVRVRVVR
jgi:isoleucyl-tRNA synthetase